MGKKSIFRGIASSLAAGIIMGYFTYFHGNLLAGIFVKDVEIILSAADYLKAYAFDCILTSFLFCFIGYFNVCGSTRYVMLQGFIGAFGIRLPVSWLMSKRVPVSLFYIGLVALTSTVVQIVLCGICFSRTFRKVI